jgi:hypothetical protein
MDARRDDPLLRPWELALVISAVLPIFFFWAGPIWKHPFEIDAAVYWSYAPIPLLVLLVSMRRRVLSLAGFLVNTITAVSVKYMITASTAFLLWAIMDAPVHPPIAHAEPTISPRPIESASDVALEVAFDSHAITTTDTEMETGRAIALRSMDGSLHTLRAKRTDGSIAFNLPVIPGRAPRTVVIKERGPLELSCTVHMGEQHGMIRVH